MSHAVTRRGDHPDIGPWVRDGLIQMHIAVKQQIIIWEGADMP